MYNFQPVNTSLYTNYGSSNEPSAPPFMPYQTTEVKDDFLEKFKNVIEKYEISDAYASKLRLLESFHVIMICDDSSSMETIMHNDQNPFNKKYTRWDELKKTVKIVSEIATVLDKDGIDVYFLNRPALFNVNNSSQLDAAFIYPPNGRTPITKKLLEVIDNNLYRSENKLLIIIATDGEPTNDNNEIDIKSLRHTLECKRKNNIHVTFLACTDDEKTIVYLHNWDKRLKNFDVVDDYLCEKNEIIEIQGKNFNFTFGDYITKILLGSIDKELCDLHTKSLKPNCCLIL